MLSLVLNQRLVPFCVRGFSEGKSEASKTTLFLYNHVVLHYEQLIANDKILSKNQATTNH